MTEVAFDLAEQLQRLRAGVIEARQRQFRQLSLEDLEDAYSVAVEDILRREHEFSSEAQLASYLHRAVANAARNIVRWHARHPASPLAPADRNHLLADGSVPEIEDVVLAEQARTLLWEFLAEQQTERDRTIGYLHLDPSHEMGALEISSRLGVPYTEVHRTVKRVDTGLGRFTAQLARPGAFCRRRRADVIAWRNTGVVPLALRIHMSHCRGCRGLYQQATGSARQAVLALLPVGGLPVGGGAVARLFDWAATNPLLHRASGAMGRWRKVAPAGGGGGAAIAAKLAAAGAVVTVSAALHAISTPAPTRHHHHRTHRAARHKPRMSPRRSVTAAGVVHGPVIETTTTTARATSTGTTTTTTTSSASILPPPPNANPLPGRQHVRATIARSGASQATGSGAAASTTTAYAPAPDQTVTTRSATSGGRSSSSGPAAPGAPPAP